MRRDIETPKAALCAMTDHYLELHSEFNKLFRIADDYRSNMCGFIEFLPNVMASGAAIAERHV